MSAMLIGLLLASTSTEPGHGPCSPGAEGPPAVSFEDGELGRPRSACLETMLGVSASGFAVIDPDNFYGDLRAAGSLAGQWLIEDDVALFGSLEVIRYDTVISSFAADRLGLGHTSLGAAYGFHSAGDFAMSTHLRLRLPTAIGLYENAHPLGADAGLSFQQRATEVLSIHATATLLGSAVVGAANPFFRAGLGLSYGLDIDAADWFRLAAGIQSQFFYTEIVDHLAGALALRAMLASEWDLELAASLPFAGRERALLAVNLSLAWRP